MWSTNLLAETLDQSLLSPNLRNPALEYCYDQFEIDKIARFKKQCDVNTENLKVVSEQFNVCMSNTYCEKSARSSDLVYYASVVVAFVGGFLIASAGR